MSDLVTSAIQTRVAELWPGSVVERIRPLGADEATHDDVTEKAIGYGKPLRLTVRAPSGERRELCLHTATANVYGHDRRADRIAELVLAYDTAGAIPRHVPMIDVGVITAGGRLASLGACPAAGGNMEASAGEPYLLTTFVPGTLYADDLRRIAATGALTARDHRRATILVDYLARLHAQREVHAARYTRAIRDVIGSGEGIFGLIDGFPDDVPAAPPARLRAIERRAADWRWRLRERTHRLAVTHGDFHPFNILFDESDDLAVLDASRGCAGDPADDAVCLALNHVFFALGHDAAWPALGQLWHAFWSDYLARTGDHEILAAAPPFVAWRALVMTNPGWYPGLDANCRDALLGLVERTLERGALDPGDADALFSRSSAAGEPARA